MTDPDQNAAATCRVCGQPVSPRCRERICNGTPDCRRARRRAHKARVAGRPEGDARRIGYRRLVAGRETVELLHACLGIMVAMAAEPAAAGQWLARGRQVLAELHRRLSPPRDEEAA